MSWSGSVGGTVEEIKAKAEDFKANALSGQTFVDRSKAQVDSVIAAVVALMEKEGAAKANVSIYGHAAGAEPQVGDTMGFSYARSE